jgi:hypothetical protein
MNRKPNLLFIVLLLFTSLACNMSAANSNEQTQAALATAVVVKEQAQQAAATAAVMAATAAVQSEGALATVQATDFQLPDLTALQQQAATLMPDENGNVTLTVQDDQLTQLIQAQAAQAAADGTAVPVQQPTVEFADGLIFFRSQVTTPVVAELSVSFQPVVTESSLRFEVVNASIGSINVPPALLQSAEDSLNNTLGAAMMHLPANISLQGVTISDGTLSVTAHRD